MKLATPIASIFAACVMVGCASVPMSDSAANNLAKSFQAPSADKAGLYIYRDSFFGPALKKDIWVDGECVGESANKVFFYKEVDGNQSHKISTESEFSENHLSLYTEIGKHYFIRQYIKLGVFVGGAGLEQVDEAEGRDAVSRLNMAVSGTCDKVLPKE